MEHIVTFLPGQFAKEDFFCVEMTGITYPDSRYRIERECSDIYCLEYVIAGEGQIETGGRLFRPSQGDVYLLPVGSAHCYRSDPSHPWEKIWMNVRGSLCDFLVRSYGLGSQTLFPACPILPLFQEFLRLCENREENEEALYRRTPLLFHEILQNLAAHTEGQNSRIPQPAARLRALLDRHLYDSLSISDFSREANLSPSQLTRIFRREYGCAPYDYLLSQKITAACMLLKNTGLSVKEIAYRLAFSDEHYFSNLFKQKTGVSPGQYRCSQPKK